VQECIDNIYLRLFKQVVDGNYEIEFEDEKFVINSNDVYENLYKLKENPLYKNLEIIDYKKLNVIYPYRRRHYKNNISKFRKHNIRFRKRKNKSITHKIRKIYVKTGEHSHINNNFDNNMRFS